MLIVRKDKLYNWLKKKQICKTVISIVRMVKHKNNNTSKLPINIFFINFLLIIIFLLFLLIIFYKILIYYEFFEKCKA
jgi:hypothetical protein